MAQFIANTATTVPMSHFDLYERLCRDLDADTLGHIERTAVTARELALAHGVDPDRAELAAMLTPYAWRMDQLVEPGRPIHEALSIARNALIEHAQASGEAQGSW